MKERLISWVNETRSLAALAARDVLVEDVMFDVELGEYDRALLKAKGDWDPTPSE